eukprot:scaffold101009_cov63-Phaeocystis_antarctica.AAC.5
MSSSPSSPTTVTRGPEKVSPAKAKPSSVEPSWAAPGGGAVGVIDRPFRSQGPASTDIAPRVAQLQPVAVDGAHEGDGLRGGGHERAVAGVSRCGRGEDVDTDDDACDGVAPHDSDDRLDILVRRVQVGVLVDAWRGAQRERVGVRAAQRVAHVLEATRRALANVRCEGLGGRAGDELPVDIEEADDRGRTGAALPCCRPGPAAVGQRGEGGLTQHGRRRLLHPLERVRDAVRHHAEDAAVPRHQPRRRGTQLLVVARGLDAQSLEARHAAARPAHPWPPQPAVAHVELERDDVRLAALDAVAAQVGHLEERHCLEVAVLQVVARRLRHKAKLRGWAEQHLVGRGRALQLTLEAVDAHLEVDLAPEGVEQQTAEANHAALRPADGERSLQARGRGGAPLALAAPPGDAVGRHAIGQHVQHAGVGIDTERGASRRAVVCAVVGGHPGGGNQVLGHAALPREEAVLGAQL